jgi:hypothetical protein
VFIIKDFLSDFEVEEIIRIAIPLQGSSQVGNLDGGGVRKSETRTSKNSWVKRSFLLTCLLIYFLSFLPSFHSILSFFLHLIIRLFPSSWQ